MNNKNGISLISLIITIIVIIILAAIVIFEGFGATESAEFARFTQEFSDYQERVSQEYRDRKTNYAIRKIKKKDVAIYEEIAGNHPISGDVSTVLPINDLSEDLKGTRYFKLQDDRTFYDGQMGVYLTDEGELFTLPGFEYVVNGITRMYVNSNKYYSESGTITTGEDTTLVNVAEECSNDSSAETWNLLNAIAKVIAVNNDSIKSPTKAIARIDNFEYELNVGDVFMVNYNDRNEPVRILGFRHDNLADTSAYGGGTTATTAGISFEFVNAIDSHRMCSSNTNAQGWENSEMRAYLNGGAGLSMMSIETRNVIKEVKKPSIKGTLGSWSLGETTDYLWLLSYDEIFSGTLSGAPGKEGTQYSLYSTITRTKTIDDEAAWWWLRSPECSTSNKFCGIAGDGNLASNNAIFGNFISVGFSI